MAVGIFLSYRRHASNMGTAAYAELAARFGRQNVFKDVESIAGGTDYVTAIEQALASCDVLIAMIDSHWAVDAAGHNRLADPDDWVRREVETALARQMPLIPFLLEGAAGPDLSVLPPTMALLDRAQTVPLRAGAWAHDMAALCNLIERVAIQKAGADVGAVVEGGMALTRRRNQPAHVMRPGSRVRIGTWAGTFKPEATRLPFDVAAAVGQTGTVLRIDGRVALVRWDAQEWSKRRLGFFRGSTVALDSFETTMNADWLEPLV